MQRRSRPAKIFEKQTLRIAPKTMTNEILRCGELHTRLHSVELARAQTENRGQPVLCSYHLGMHPRQVVARIPAMLTPCAQYPRVPCKFNLDRKPEIHFVVLESCVFIPTVFR